MLDIATFDADASDLLGVSISLFSDAVLIHPNVSADLVQARAL